jgi:hypothetical protein
MATKQETLWFGYLDAGKKGSFVVRDVTLGTGTPATFYLFNLNRGAILEYRRDIAEPKLRELTEKEADKVDELRAAFEQARKGFTPREERKPKPLPPTRKKARVEEVEEQDDEDDTDIEIDDDDDADAEIEADDDDDEKPDSGAAKKAKK